MLTQRLMEPWNLHQNLLKFTPTRLLNAVRDTEAEMHLDEHGLETHHPEHREQKP
jgi:hypothetical protein